MSNNENQNKKQSSLPEGLSSIADDEAITEINLTDFLEESTNSAPLFEGFHDDIEKTEKSIESELQSLYDDIMGSGPETIVPKPMSVLTSSEAEPKKVVLSDPEVPDENENNSLDDLWMNPEDYFDDDIPVVSLDSEEEQAEIPNEAFFAPESAAEAEVVTLDSAKDDIMSMIDMLKSDSDSDAGFSEILSEIESNQGIATVENELSSASQIVTDPAAFEADFVNLDIEPEVEMGSLEEDFSKEENTSESVIVIDEEKDVPEADNEPEIVAEKEPIEDFEEELRILLGEDVSAQEAEVPAAEGFVIDVPDDGNDYEAAAAQPEKLYNPEPMSSGISFITEEEFDANFVEEKGKKNKKKKKENKEKTSGGAGEVIRKIVLAVSIVTIIASCGLLVNTYIIEPMRFKKTADELADQMNVSVDKHDETEVVDSFLATEFPDVIFPDGMLAKYAQLYAANNDLKGWISIPGLEINLPVAQSSNNEFYLKKDIYGKYTSYGVPFFDFRMTDFKNLHMNNVIYGHNMRSDDYIFGMLENYRTIDGFAQAPVIECNTIFGDYTWFVYGVFISNSDASDDNGYVFPYNFIDLPTEKFESYIKEIDKRKLYTTGVTLEPTDKILTLSTCCYDFDDAKLVVVARLKREGESVNVDTSKAYENPNPKYPQAWYDAMKKTNPYAEDARW
ncbi:MAG: sortase [Ruminococcaceae bacterium]|nr:sortase [Oscillospiraceae bacterium]